MVKAVQVIPQDGDTYAQSRKRKNFAIRYASVRSLDSREHSQPGQDYLSFQLEPKAMSFVVCDGVSQSFNGDIASKYLGERLLDWIRSEAGNDLDKASFGSNLLMFLQNITSFASDIIRGYQIPEETPDLFREVLEEKRSLGSETTFVFGYLEIPNERSPEGLVILSYMGDTRIRVGQGKEWGSMLNDFATEGKKRWSTRKGAVGGPPAIHYFTLFENKRQTINRIVSYTDGLSVLDEVQTRPQNKKLNELIEKSVNSTNNDDASFLEIEIL